MLVLIITQSADQSRIRSILQLIKGISRVFQKLLKYFSGTNISTSFISQSSFVWHVIFALKLNESITLLALKLTIVLSILLSTAGILYWLTISMYFALYISVLFILLMQLVNGAKFLNITFLLVLFASAPSATVYFLYCYISSIKYVCINIIT